MPLVEHDTIVVVDFGSRHSQTLARRVRGLNIYSEVWPASAPRDRYIETAVKGVVAVIGAEQTAAADKQQAEAVWHQLGLPVLNVSDEGEVTDEALAAFVLERCRAEANWTPERFIEAEVGRIREAVGPEGRVVCGLSGGVDSSVAAALVYEAIGNRLVTIFVDNGLMRKDEPQQVNDIFSSRFSSNFIHADAGDQFLDRLAGVTDPEEKRRIIGEQFIRVFEAEANALGDVRYLVQGTVYPDVIESGVGGAMVKSHHNVGGLPERMQLKLVEPLRQLFKDEVRRVGEALGLPHELVWRQPFPGPGLGIRVIGEVTRERLAAARSADAIFRDELDRAGLTASIWQSFVVLTSTRAVGVQEEGRTYGYVAALRAVDAVDGMTATWVHLPYDVLARVSDRIMQEVPAIGRVVYDISSKPPGTIEWE